MKTHSAVFRTTLQCVIINKYAFPLLMSMHNPPSSTDFYSLKGVSLICHAATTLIFLNKKEAYETKPTAMFTSYSHQKIIYLSIFMTT